MRRNFVLLSVGLTAFAATSIATKYAKAPRLGPPGMVWIPGGEFTMGTDSDLAWPDETPAHRVRVHGFWMDEAEVTNAQFRAFVAATGYVTTAEKGRRHRRSARSWRKCPRGHRLRRRSSWSRLAGLHSACGPGGLARLLAMVDLDPWRELARSRGAG
jgi:formylglycine-generating enzyme required for sulfatase activity